MKNRVPKKTLAFILSLSMLSTMPASVFAANMENQPPQNEQGVQFPDDSFQNTDINNDSRNIGVYINQQPLESDAELVWFNQIWAFSVVAFRQNQFEIEKDGDLISNDIESYELTDGKYNITIYGKGADIYRYSFGFDSHKPEFSAVYNPDSRKLRFVCQEDTSGIAAYCVNGSDRYVETDEYGVLSDADEAGAVTVIDGAGNIADFRNPEVYQLAVDTNGYTVSETPSKEVIKLTPKISDDISKYNYKIQYSNDGENWTDAVDDKIFVANTDGIETYIIRAVFDDESGFEICRSSVDVNADTVMPDNAGVGINGEQDADGWYITVPEVYIAAPDTDRTTYRFDGVEYTVDAGKTTSLPSELFDEGIHTLVVDVTDSAGNTVSETYEIKVNAVAPEINSMTVNTLYRISDRNIYCSGDLSISFNLSDEVTKIVPVCDGQPLDSSLYTINNDTVSIKNDTIINGKIGVMAYDAQNSEVIYYAGDISGQYQNSFTASATTSYDDAYKFIYENSVLGMPDIKFVYIDNEGRQRENRFNSSSDECATGWTKENVKACFIKQSDKEFSYQYKKADSSEWYDCDSEFEISEGGEYDFRSVSETGVYSEKLTVNVRICKDIPKQGAISILNGSITNNSGNGTWYKELEVELRNENPYDDSVPKTITHCDIYKTDSNGTNKIGYVRIAAGETAEKISMTNSVTLTEQNSAADFTVNNSGIYEFRYFTADEAGNYTDTVSTFYNVQCEEPVIYSLNFENRNLIDSKNLYFMSADLSQLTVDADFGFSGPADSDAVVCEYKSVLSQEWKKCDNANLFNDDKYDIRVTIKNKAGMTAVADNVSIIVDTKMPTGENNAPEIKIAASGTSKNGIYNGDVNIDISAKDPAQNNVYSGLERVSYWINDNETGEVIIEDDIFNYDIEKNIDIDDVQQSFSDRIVIPSWVDTNFTISVEAVDNAGNRKVSSKSIKQDTSAPDVVVSYDNNRTVNGLFNASRTAKITIDERNFNPSDVVIQASNADGAAPSVSGWSSNGSIHTATVTFADDGNYSFNVSYTDSAGNEGSVEYIGESPNSFTIDKTAPVIKLTYDNYDAVNGSYYNKKRTATITVEDKNVDTASLSSGINISAMLDGEAVSVPSASWSSNGNVHTCVIEFADDAEYSFTVAVSDTAGNSNGLSKQSFTIDTAAPNVSITGVYNMSANKGSVMPVIEYSDSNLDEKNVSISLRGANNGNVGIIKENYKITNGTRIAVNNFIDAEKLDSDDLYILEVTATDNAGLSTTKKVEFSINRTGPVYVIDESLNDYLNNYNKEPEDIKIFVYDVDPIVESHINVIKDGTSSFIAAEKDYSVTAVMPDAEQEIYRYTYEYLISAKNFEQNGTYNVILTAKDNAENNSDNTASKLSLKVGEEKETSAEIRFTIDNIAPTVIFDNLNSNGKYNTDVKNVSFIMHDNISSLSLASIEIFVNGNKVDITDDGEKYSFVVNSSSSSQDISVKCTDNAGNVNELTFNNVLVTSDKFKLYQKQIIAVLIALIVMIISGTIIITKKNSKNSH